MTHTWPVLLLAALAHQATTAQEGALPDAPACRRALDTLEAHEAAAARDRGARGTLDVARREAAAACLGARAAASTPRRAAPPPARTVPARPAAPPPAPGPAVVTPAPPLPLPRPAAPLTVTACDATGCWASDGSRLQRVGPNLLGPGGQSCTTSGTLLHCTR